MGMRCSSQPSWLQGCRRSDRYSASQWRTCIPDLLVEKVNTILSHLFEAVQDRFGVPGRVAAGEGQFTLHRDERVSHCYRTLGEVCWARGKGDID